MFHNILWSVDPTAPAAPPLARLRALDGDADSHVRSMAVLEPFDHLYAAPRGRLDPKLGQWRRLEPLAPTVHRVEKRHGGPAFRELPADLIVVASHGWTGLSGVFFGSTVRRVVRGADVPVLITRTPASTGQGGSS